jgi:hypothetical protein
MGIEDVLFNVIDKIYTIVSYSFGYVVWPITKILVYFMGFVLIITFIGNIAGILGFFLFMVMFYYYVKGIIYIQPAT